MQPLQLSEKLQEEYLKKLLSRGESGLYSYIVGSVLHKWASGSSVKNPDVEILDLAEAFFSVSRATGNKDFFVLGKVLRRAAHKICRSIKAIDKKKQINPKFLRVVGK